MVDMHNCTEAIKEYGKIRGKCRNRNENTDNGSYSTAIVFGGPTPLKKRKLEVCIRRILHRLKNGSLIEHTYTAVL